MTLLLNGFLLCIAYKDFENALFFDKIIQDHYFKENETYDRIVYLYAKGELHYHLENKTAGLQKMQQAIEILQILGCDQSADYYQQSLEQILKND